MDRKSIERLAKDLQARGAELRQRIAQSQAETAGEKLDYGKDEGDRANASLSREIDLGQKSRDHALLSAIDAALERIRLGTFGECFHCGTEIGVKRLDAIPWVQYCISCQELIAENH